MSQVQEQDLRELVRQMLAEAVPRMKSNEEVRTVHITNDEQLAGFVREVLDLAQHPTTLARMRGGVLKFTLGLPMSGNSHSPTPPPAEHAPQHSAQQAPSGVLHIEKGAITERVIVQAAQNNTRIVAGVRAVVTPLARESARKHGVVIERAS